MQSHWEWMFATFPACSESWLQGLQIIIQWDSTINRGPRKRKYKKETQQNVLRSQFTQFVRPHWLSTWPASNATLYRCCYSWRSIQHLYQQSHSFTDLDQSRNWDKVHKEVQKTKGIRLRVGVENALLVCKLIWASVFRKPPNVKRKPKFIWMGFVLFFLEMNYFKNTVLSPFKHTRKQCSRRLDTTDWV